MTLDVLFWVIMIIVFVAGVWWNWPRSRDDAGPFGSWIVIFLLIGMLGWRVFGPVVK